MIRAAMSSTAHVEHRGVNAVVRASATPFIQQGSGVTFW
jgi:hypothetical protein